MPLSEHEQRILDEIERRLAAEDPDFARSATAATPRGVALRRIKLAGFGFALGIALLVGGLLAGLDNANLLFVFGLAGFGVMLASVIVIAKASKSFGTKAPRPHAPAWFTRAEERWRRRFDRGNEQ